MKTITLSRDIYEELYSLVAWQSDAPVSIERCLDDLAEYEADIFERAGHPELSMARFDEAMEIVAEDKDGHEWFVERAD
jgi:hypothetical protein